LGCCKTQGCCVVGTELLKFHALCPLQETESGGMDKDDESEKSDDDEEENPLVVPLAENLKPSKDHLAQQWFSQDVFSGIDAVEELSDDEKVRGQGKKSKGLKVHSSERLDDDDDDLDDEMDAVITGPTSNGFSNGDHHVTSLVENDDFEIVPAEASASSDSDTSEDSDQDSDTGKAEILAYAKKMLRKKSRESIIDAAYNRYTFNDVGLPHWFADDERKHSQPMKPITKDEVEAMKVLFQNYPPETLHQRVCTLCQLHHLLKMNGNSFSHYPMPLVSQSQNAQLRILSIHSEWWDLLTYHDT